MACKNVSEGVPAEEEVDAWFCRKLVESSRKGDLVLYTSLLTLAECLHVGHTRKGDRNVPEKARDLFDRLITSGNSGITAIEPSIFVIRRAVDLSWVDKINLSPFDGIHIASALEVGCKEFLTGDMKLINRGKKRLAGLGLNLLLPSQTELLPAEYRQIKAIPLEHNSI